MKELEDTKCEVRRVIDLQFSIWDRLNASIEDEGIVPPGSPRYDGSGSPLGNFFEDSTYAWLSSGPRLVVINVRTGTSISSWTFRDRVTCVSEFPTQPGQIPLLLVGLDNGASKVRDSLGIVCIFDCTTSQVIRAIRMPAGVEQACVIIGGAEWEDYGDKRIDNLLGEYSGMACIALRNLDHLMIDLRRASWEGPDAVALADEHNPVELDFTEHSDSSSIRWRSSREKHAAYNLMNSRLEQFIGFNREEFESSSLYQEPLTSALICSRKIGCLVSGCLGRIIIWQTDGDVRWISTPLDESMAVTHLALLEPTDDPRPFCYLWSAHQEETCRSPPILRMYAMLFERKYTDKGTNSYFNLEADPSVKFELELDENDRITSLCPIIRESNPEQTDTIYKRGEDSLLLITLDTRMLLFDLNQWYKEQMPHTIGECNNPNTIISSYRTRPKSRGIADETIVNCAYVPKSLQEFPCNGSSPPEELFFPNSLSFEWIDLSTGSLTIWLTRGVQAELLREMSLTGPVIIIEPSETFHRCLSVGLVPTNGEFSVNADKDTQREILLSLCLEQRWSQFLLRCAKEWSDGSASYLFHAFLRWGMQRASSIKLTADRLSVPLYDQSGTSIGESEVKALRFYSQQLECITSVVMNLSVDSVNLTNERRALRRVSTYLQVLLWFYDVGLLPETQEIEDEATFPISFSLKIPYPYEKLATIYREKRQQFAKKSTKNVTEHEEDMFIDELITRECPSLRSQWEREGNELSIGGYYPPSSLQSLLRSYLTDCHNSNSSEMENKHQITIYLLMDLAMLLQNSCPSVNQLIKYPSAFKLSPSLIKLTQALWLLDHEDYHGFLDTMTGHLVSDSDVKDWHHKLVMRTLIRNNQNKLALIYLRVRKPPLSSLDEQGTAISLSVEHGLVQSAFHRRPPSHYAQLLTSFFRACNKHGKLNDILHLALDHEEEEAFVKFLENEKAEDTRLLYYLQRCRYAEASTVYPIGQSAQRGNYLRNNEKSAPISIFNAYNATLPDITRKFSATIGRNVRDIDPSSRYPRPMSHCKNRITSRDIHESVMKKARETFLRCDRSRIPFVSAPCSSSRSQDHNVDNNCVLFVERAKKPYGKRTLDDMRGDDSFHIDNEDDRKRRKTLSSIDKTGAGEREIGTSMAFDTPMVKRKNQIISARETPVETPHSILKIRQLIRESTSPTIAAGRSEISESTSIVERERKPRHIRFSIGHQRSEEISTDEIAGDNEDSARHLVEGNVTDESEETAKSLEKADISEEESEDAYFSPNISEQSCNETTVLSDTSSFARNVSGPRPRPSLRRSNESTTSDLLRKSLIRANADASVRLAGTPTMAESSSIMGDYAFSFDRNSTFSKSFDATSILSSDTSFESTLPIHKRKSPTKEEHVVASERDRGYSFTEQSIERCRDISNLSRGRERSEILGRYTQIVKRTSIKTTMVEESVRDLDEDSEVLMEVDGFGLDRESSTRSPHEREYTWEIENSADRAPAIKLSTIRSFTETIGTESNENPIEQHEEVDKEDYQDAEEDAKNREGEEDKEEEKEELDRSELSGVSTQSGNSPSKDLENREIEINESEAAKLTEDCDDESLGLKYDEDDDQDETNDDVFQSLSNSLNVAPSSARSSLEKSIVATKDYDEDDDDEADVLKKSTIATNNNGFYEIPKIASHESNITDDESSRSVDDSIVTADSTSTTNSLEKTVSVEKIMPGILEEASNMTDDNSTSSFDSSLFTVKIPSQDLQQSMNSLENLEKINEHDSSHDSSLFSNKKLTNRQENLLKSAEKRRESNKIANANSSTASATLSSNTTDNDASGITTDFVEEKKMSKSELNVEESPRAKGRNQSMLMKKIDSMTPNRTKSPLTILDTEASISQRMTRSRRASSVMQDSPVIESPPAKSTTGSRLRRATSLVKDIFASSDENSLSTTEIQENPETSTYRLRRSTSLATEAFPRKSLATEVSPRDNEGPAPISRRTRRATSVQKESPVVTKTKVTRSSSKISLSESNPDDASIVPKTRKTRTNSVSKDETMNVTSKRMTRASSLAKDISDKNSVGVLEKKEIPEKKKQDKSEKKKKEIKEEESEDVSTSTRRPTRKRGSSVPKEITLEISTRASRTKRGSSVAKEVIPEETSEDVNETKSGKRNASMSKEKAPTDRTKLISPATSTRSRLSSITSILEEEEENEESEDETSSSTKMRSSNKRKISREMRALSADLSHVDVKRRTRNTSTKSAIIDEPIEEEPLEIEAAAADKNTKSTRRGTARKNRTTNTTSLKDNNDETVEKLPVRRTRKLSHRSNENEDFRFSPPDQAHDRPNEDEKGIVEVPDYIFSPPHTRSKLGTVAPRREMKDFILITDKAREAGNRRLAGFVRRPRASSTNQMSISDDKLGLPRVFRLPKRSESITDDK